MTVRSAIVHLLIGLMSLVVFARAESIELFPPGSTWHLFRSRSGEPNAENVRWQDPEFDDSGWEVASAPFCFGFEIDGTRLEDMRGSYSCIYLRKKFRVEAPWELERLMLRVVAEDGFVAWLDGYEIARQNVQASEPKFDARADTEITATPMSESYAIEDVQSVLKPGTHVLAVQAFSAGSADDDFLFDASLVADIDTTLPVVETVVPAPGEQLHQLWSIEVQFSEFVIGVDASDLLINGVPATNVLQITPSDYLFTFAQPTDGLVAVQWHSDHGITDRVGPSHPFKGGSWTYTLDATQPASSLFISEFMASNKDTLNDEDGESSDWIEIANVDSEPASLAGWFLTDDPSDLTKWRFPNVEIAARGFLIVFASGKNRTDPVSRLHTNFKLASDSGYLALVDPRTNVVSDFAPGYPKQFPDVSYGRVAGELGATGYFVKPTPGAPNADGGPGFAPEVGFSKPSGTFTTPFELELRPKIPGAVIRYTLDGTLPTTNSPLYTGPILITNSVQVRARAYQDSLLPGPPKSESYILLHSNLMSFNSDLPVIVLHALGKGVPSASRLSFAHMSVFEPVVGRTSLTNKPTFTSRVGLQIRGSSTEGLAKSSYKVEVWDEFNMDRKVEILGMPADSDWVLYAPNNFEPVLIHNPFVHQLSRYMGRYSPRTRFVEVYLNKTTGPISSTHYAGIYVLEEKIKIGPNRVNIGKLEPEHTKPPEITGGYLMKFDRLDPGDSGLSAGGATIAMVDPKEKEIKSPQRLAQKNYIVSYLNTFQRALYSTNWRDSVSGYKAYIDVPAWIDYHVLEVLSGNVDALVLSAYFHKPRNGLLSFGPHWDFDRALGSTDGRDSNPRVWNTGPFFSATWWSRLFNDVDFWQAWVDRWQELRETHFSLANLHGLVDRLADEVRQAQPREYAKWRVTLRGGSYQSEVNLMKTWLSNRLDFIDRQLTQPPVLGSTGGLVPVGYALEITVPAGATVYYTLDGTDPRASQGGLAPGARVYTGPIKIDSNIRVVARARDVNKRQTGGPPVSTPWSRPVAATFYVNLPRLIVTEIMFHPATPPFDVGTNPSELEFIELKNTEAHVLNLTGFRITNGIQFSFTSTGAVTSLQPGERVLIVKNRAAFEACYPHAGPIAGEFTGNLGNKGDRITLVGPMGEVVWDVAYQDTWQPLADGFGFSLVLRDENIPLDLLGNPVAWQLSSAIGGSPGAPDPDRPHICPVRISEVRANPIPPDLDVVELVNPCNVPADISNWYLTDDFRQPFKHRIRPGTIIPPRGILVIDESEFGFGPGGFGLGAQGDEIFLFSADEWGKLTGYFHGMAFGASPPGATFGSYRSSDGLEQCVLEQAPSIGRFNFGPRANPVVISEIMSRPRSTGQLDGKFLEYIELYNSSPEPVKCYTGDQPAKTWAIQGTAEFNFPPGIILSPGECVLVVGFDPEREPGILAEFRKHYSLTSTVRVFGPWLGSLSEAGNLTVRLVEPCTASEGDSDSNGKLDYYVLEQVLVKNGSAWPSGDMNDGWSLGRRFPRMYANDPAAWILSRPGPGIIDSDGDGLPDEWEMRYGLNPFSDAGNDGAHGDPDGDGLSNEVEYRTGNEPWPGPTRIECRKSTGTGTVVQLNFVNLPFRTVTLLRSDSPCGPVWEPVMTVPPIDKQVTNSFSESATAPARYYKLELR